MQITSLHSLNAFLLPIKTVGVQVNGFIPGVSWKPLSTAWQLHWGARIADLWLKIKGLTWEHKLQVTGIPTLLSCVGAKVLRHLNRHRSKWQVLCLRMSLTLDNTGHVWAVSSKSRRPLLYTSCPLYGWEVLDWVDKTNKQTNSASYTWPCLCFPALFWMVLYPCPCQERSQSRPVRVRKHSTLHRGKVITKHWAGILTELRALTWKISKYLSLFYQYWITPLLSAL